MRTPDPQPTRPTPAGTLGGRTAVIASGQLTDAPERTRAAQEALHAVKEAGGIVVNHPLDTPMPQQLDDLADAETDLIIAVGGDGTVNAAASIAVRWEIPVLILPTGTMNLVAKDLHLPIDPSAILAGAGELTVLLIDHASVNGHVFLHSALIGVVPELSSLREQMRGEADLMEGLRHIPELLDAALNSEEVNLRLQADSGSHEQRTRSVAVSNNPLSEDGMITHTRQTVAAGTLGVYASAHEGPLASVKLLASLGTGRLPRDPETLSTCCREITIHADAGTIPVSLDGEVRHLEPPLVFRNHTRALRVVIPTAFIGEAPP